MNKILNSVLSDIQDNISKKNTETTRQYQIIMAGLAKRGALNSSELPRKLLEFEEALFVAINSDAKKILMDIFSFVPDSEKHILGQDKTRFTVLLENILKKYGEEAQKRFRSKDNPNRKCYRPEDYNRMNKIVEENAKMLTRSIEKMLDIYVEDDKPKEEPVEESKYGKSNDYFTTGRN